MREKLARLMMNRDNEAGEVWCEWESKESEAEATRESYRVTASLLLTLISEEIEKGLLTDEERMAVSIPCETCKEATLTNNSPIPDFDTTVCLDCAAKCHNKAQLQKILALLIK